MIRSDSEYKQTVKRLEKEKAQLADYVEQLKAEGLPPDQVKRLMAPLKSASAELEELIAEYERIKRGDLGSFTNLHGLGRILIAVRIALGLSQRQFAQRLGIHPTQVCRDERNEYHGITIERAAAILDAFDLELDSFFKRPLILKKTKQTKAA